MNMTTRVDDLILIGGRLADLLKKENEALRAHRTTVSAEILEEKTALSHAFESRFKGLAAKRDDLVDLDEELGERLRGMAVKVHALMEDNDRLLTVALAAHEKVVEAIAEAVESSRPGPNLYTASGERREPKAGGVRNTPVSLDRAL